MPEISPKAFVETSARIADDVRIGPFSYIGPDVEIGPGCIIENNATVTGRTVMGAGNHVYPMAVVGSAGPGDGQAGCVIGSANTIHEHATVFAGDEAPTRIGDNNLIMIACTVDAGALVADHAILVNCTHVGAGASIAEYVQTSGFAIIQPGGSVGAYTFIAAGHAVIDHHTPPFAIVTSAPYRVRGVNAEKLRRCGFADEDIRALRRAFRELFNGPGDPLRPPNLDTLDEALLANPYVAQLAEHLRRSAGPPGASGHG